MSIKHTPGPWEWDGDYTLRPANPRPELHTVHTILSPDGESFGFMAADYKDVLAENAANKVLMAAAPELLDALSEAKRIFDWLESRSLYQDKDLRGVHEKMRAAIAKATGEAA